MAAVYEHGRVNGPQHHDQLLEIPPENEENNISYIDEIIKLCRLIRVLVCRNGPITFHLTPPEYEEVLTS